MCSLSISSTINTDWDFIYFLLITTLPLIHYDLYFFFHFNSAIHALNSSPKSLFKLIPESPSINAVFITSLTVPFEYLSTPVSSRFYRSYTPVLSRLLNLRTYALLQFSNHLVFPLRLCFFVTTVSVEVTNLIYILCIHIRMQRFLA